MAFFMSKKFIFLSSRTMSENRKFSNKQIGALADAFGKSLLTIQRWITKNDDRLTSDKAKKALKQVSE